MLGKKHCSLAQSCRHVQLKSLPRGRAVREHRIMAHAEAHCFNASSRWMSSLVEEGTDNVKVKVGQKVEGASAKIAAHSKWEGRPGQVLMLHDVEGRLESVLLGVGATEELESIWPFASLPTKLPAGIFELEEAVSPKRMEQALLGWALGCYKFDR
ncbi:hypothetical protein DUNSADRAFT_10972, partial [Dunaliella salina]